MKHRNVTSPKGHFLIVISEDPVRDQLVVLDVITSKVDAVKARIKLADLDSDTAIELSPQQLHFLSKPSIVNCNDPKVSQLEIFSEDLKAPEAHFVGALPPEILDRIVRASIRSRMVKPEHKRCISEKIYQHFCQTEEQAKRGGLPAVTIKVSPN